MAHAKDIKAQAKDIKEHMEVVGSDGKHVGTVDHMEGPDKIKLTKNDPAAHGQHHFIALSMVASVDANIHLNKSAKDVMAHWKSAA